MIEDGALTLQTNVDYVDRMPRADEAIFLEVTNFPDGVTFRQGSVEYTEQIDGLILVPYDESVEIRIASPKDFSGVFSFDVAFTLREGVDLDGDPIDFGETAVRCDFAQTYFIEVQPRADTTTRAQVEVLEDQAELIKFSSLVDQGLIQDDGTSLGNNPETETIIEARIEVPNATSTFALTVEGFFATLVDVNRTVVGNVEVLFGDSQGRKDFVLRSLLVPKGKSSNNDQLLAISQADREQATTDILAVLAQMEFSLQPEHTDDDGKVQLSVTTADVNTDVQVSRSVNTRTTTWNPILVKAIADPPSLEVESPAATVIFEDDGVIPLFIEVTASPDRDDSEVLSVLIDIPSGYGIDGEPVGELSYIGGGSLPAGFSLQNIASGRWLIQAEGATPETREALLNSVLSTREIAFVPRDGFGETLDPDNAIVVELISEERASGEQVADGLKTSSVNATIILEVIPVADAPTLGIKGNAIGKEDVRLFRSNHGIVLTRHHLLTLHILALSIDQNYCSN